MELMEATFNTKHYSQSYLTKDSKMKSSRITLNIYIICCVVQLKFSSQQSLEVIIKHFMEEGGNKLTVEPDDVDFILEEYDFVIIGAGTAGCVLANRLTEIGEWTVLLIEAGGTETIPMDVPLIAPMLQFTEANWAYKSIPSDKYCLGMDGSQCNIPRGKVVGGSSVLNFMIYTRGNWRDYDNWEKLGNPGWSYKDVLPYFKMIENFSIPEPYDEIYHGKDGYLTVGYPPYRTKIAEAFVESGIQSGLNYTDYNGPHQVGISYLQTTIKDGLRHSSSRAYLHPIRNRKNLHLKKNAMVTKILIDELTKTATGVEFIANGRKQVVKARKEVISSAGAINSPQLLMLSGVGPKKHLTKLGIPTLSNLRVGYNLMDHIAVGGLTFLIDKPYSLRGDVFYDIKTWRELVRNRNGPATMPGTCEVISFHDLKNPTDPDGYPDIELFFSSGSLLLNNFSYKTFGITDQLFNEMYMPDQLKQSFMVFPMLLRPKSKGRLLLKDNKPTSKPLIFPNYLSEKEDIDTLVAGVRLVLDIIKQPALARIGTKLLDKPLRECVKHGFATDKYFECMARQFTFNIYHQSGTCKMGPSTDRRAVVDSRLKVYGVKGLRVIDASIIPEIMAAHTNAPTYMIAEKGADMIKEDWQT